MPVVRGRYEAIDRGNRITVKGEIAGAYFLVEKQIEDEV